MPRATVGFSKGAMAAAAWIAGEGWRFSLSAGNPASLRHDGPSSAAAMSRTMPASVWRSRTHQTSSPTIWSSPYRHAVASGGSGVSGVGVPVPPVSSSR